MRVRNTRRAILVGEVIKTSTPRRRRRKIRLGPYGGLLIAALVVILLVEAAALTYAELKFRGRALDVPGMEAPSGQGSIAVVTTRPGKSPSGVVLDSVVLIRPRGPSKRVVAVHMPPELRVRMPSGKTARLTDAFDQGLDPLRRTLSGTSGLPIDLIVVSDLRDFADLARSAKLQMSSTKPLKLGAANLHEACEKVDEGMYDLIANQTGTGSLERMRRLLTVLIGTARKSDGVSGLIDPFRVIRTAKRVTAAMEWSHKTGYLKARRWIELIAGLETSSIDLRTVPVSEPAAKIQGVVYVIANERQTRELFAALAKGTDLPPVGKTSALVVEPSDISLTVLNGTYMEGLAKRVAKDLAGRGFAEAPTANAPVHETSVVYYRPGNQQKARLVSTRFGLDVKEITAEIPSTSDVTLVLGTDFADGKVRLLTEEEVVAQPPATDTPPTIKLC